jgi:hypothetical protein
MTPMPTSPGAKLWKGATAMALALAVGSGLLGPAPVAIGQEAAHRPALPELRQGLQGMRFAGSLGVKDDADPQEEILSFADGRFTSRICREYGFPPAPYWVRRDADGLHFFAELHNPENGTIRFEGVFDGEEMQATALWTKERWYWTLEQKLFFEGRPVGQAG